MGHEGVLTTFSSYGEVQPGRQPEIFKALQRSRSLQSGKDVDALAKPVVREINAQQGA